MGKLAIRKKVIRKIESIENKSYLEALYKFIEASEPQAQYRLSKEEKDALKEAKAQIKKGEFLTQKEVDTKAKKWLRGK